MDTKNILLAIESYSENEFEKIEWKIGLGIKSGLMGWSFCLLPWWLGMGIFSYFNIQVLSWPYITVPFYSILLWTRNWVLIIYI